MKIAFIIASLLIFPWAALAEEEDGKRTRVTQ